MWNGTVFVDLDWPLNASSLLSASAELLVYYSAHRAGSYFRYVLNVVCKYHLRFLGPYSIITNSSMFIVPGRTELILLPWFIVCCECAISSDISGRFFGHFSLSDILSTADTLSHYRPMHCRTDETCDKNPWARRIDGCIYRRHGVTHWIKTHTHTHTHTHTRTHTHVCVFTPTLHTNRHLLYRHNGHQSTNESVSLNFKAA